MIDSGFRLNRFHYFKNRISITCEFETPIGSVESKIEINQEFINFVESYLLKRFSLKWSDNFESTKYSVINNGNEKKGVTYECN